MSGWRFAFFSILICLPAMLIVGVGGWLVGTQVPRAIRFEPSRIGRAYRDIAEDMISHPNDGAVEMKRQVGWRQVGKVSGIPWGYVVDGEKTTVWHLLAGKMCRVREVPAIRPFPYALVCYGGGAFVATVLIGLSLLAVLGFRRYLKVRDDFVAATAHDLTTPLVGLRMTIGRDDEEAKRLVSRLLVIVGNLKDFLRLGGRYRPLSCGCFDLTAMCREAYLLFREDYRDLFDGEDVEIGPEKALRVVADETLTLQILWNLFGNALKYAAPHGKVFVRLVDESRFIRVEFADEGPGMSAHERRHAFDRYYRAKTVLKSGKGGFGIGLCTAREFARMMGGELTVCANVPKGCVFALSLPKAM